MSLFYDFEWPSKEQVLYFENDLNLKRFKQLYSCVSIYEIDDGINILNQRHITHPSVVIEMKAHQKPSAAPLK